MDQETELTALEQLQKKIQRKILEVRLWGTIERSPWTTRRSATFPSGRTFTSSRR